MNKLTVRLLDDHAGGEQRIGPIEHVNIEGAVLKLPGYQPATYCEGRWVWDDLSFLWLEIDVPTRIQLNTDIEHRVLPGPFEALRIIGGAIHAWDPHRRPFARFNAKSGLWHIYSDGSTWPQIVILAAATEPLAGE